MSLGLPVRVEANKETEEVAQTPEFSGIVVHVPDILSNLQGMVVEIIFEAQNFF